MQNFLFSLKQAEADLFSSRDEVARFLGPKQGIVIVGRVDRSPNGAREIARYAGRMAVCYVNPRPGEANGATIYPSVLEVPDGFDTAVIRVPAKHVEAVLADCGTRGIRDVVVFSAGFSEAGSEGEELERSLAQCAQAAGIRLIGPNTTDNLFEVFPSRQGDAQATGISIITQSGATGRALIEGIAMGASINRWVTLGNEADLELANILDYFARDPLTRVIACYVEGFKSPEKLRFALEEANRTATPVVMLKIGASASGARMAASHTGHISGWDAIVQGLLDQYGVTRVRDLNELLETSNLFAKLKGDRFKRATIYSFSGGTSTLMAEIAEQQGLTISTLTQETQIALANFLPAGVAKENPVDNGGRFTFEAALEDRLAVLDLLLNDPNTDVLVIGFNAAFGMLSDTMAADLAKWVGSASKPVIATWSSVLTNGSGYADLVKSGIPIFHSITGCFKALAAYCRYRDHQLVARERNRLCILTGSEAFALDDCSRGVLPNAQVRRFLEAYGIPLLHEEVVASPLEARRAAAKIGFPVAIKICSPDFPHKTDLGLVKLNVMSSDEAEQTSDEILQSARWAQSRARIDGVTVQEMAGAGIEILVGLSRDNIMGPALTIAAGGIHAEYLNDVAVRPLPVDEADVREMIGGLRIARLLKGVRGAPPSDVDGLVDVAMAVARIGLEHDNLIELDLNPVIVEPSRCVVVDVLAIAEPA